MSPMYCDGGLGVGGGGGGGAGTVMHTGEFSWLPPPVASFQYIMPYSSLELGP